MPPARFESAPWSARPTATPAEASTVTNDVAGIPSVSAAETNTSTRSVMDIRLFKKERRLSSSRAKTGVILEPAAQEIRQL